MPRLRGVTSRTTGVGGAGGRGAASPNRVGAVGDDTGPRIGGGSVMRSGRAPGWSVSMVPARITAGWRGSGRDAVVSSSRSGNVSGGGGATGAGGTPNIVRAAGVGGGAGGFAGAAGGAVVEIAGMPCGRVMRPIARALASAGGPADTGAVGPSKTSMASPRVTGRCVGGRGARCEPSGAVV